LGSKALGITAFGFQPKKTSQVYAEDNYIYVVEHMKNKVVQLCSSLNQPCGIASYTEMLCKNNGLRSVKSVNELKNASFEILHLQHEFGIMSAKEINKVIGYCSKNSVKLYVTLHAVIPSASLVSRMLVLKYAKKTQGRSSSDLDSLAKNITIRKLLERALLVRKVRQQRMLVNYAKKIIVHLPQMAETLEKMGVEKDKIVVLDHPVQSYKTSPCLYSDADQKTHIGCFGFLEERNNFLKIIDLVANDKDIILHIYANIKHKGKKQEYVDKVLEKVKRSQGIHIATDHLSIEEIVFNLSQCNANIWHGEENPFYYYASGSIRQYLAAKRPIIAFKNTRIKELESIVTTIPAETASGIEGIAKKSCVETKPLEKYLEQHGWETAISVYS